MIPSTLPRPNPQIHAAHDSVGTPHAWARGAPADTAVALNPAPLVARSEQ